MIFIRNPVRGKVKTRLAASIGPDEALKIYENLLGHTREISTATMAHKWLFYADYVERDDSWPRDIFTKKRQTGTDLGEKMFNAFENAFESNYGSVIIIGSDCPGLTTTLLETAFTYLTTKDIVIGPSNDGGYYLLGMRQPVPQIFQNKSWSTPTVLEQTLADISMLGLSVELLPELTDIDTIHDWQAWQQQTARS